MHYFTLKDHRRPLEFLLRVLECWKPQNEPISKISKNFGKYPKGGPLEKRFFSFLFNIIFNYGISNETIRMPFRGLTILKSPKLTIKGGLCYGFAMVAWKEFEIALVANYFTAIIYHSFSFCLCILKEVRLWNTPAL